MKLMLWGRNNAIETSEALGDQTYSLPFSQ